MRLLHSLIYIVSKENLSRRCCFFFPFKVTTTIFFFSFSVYINNHLALPSIYLGASPPPHLLPRHTKRVHWFQEEEGGGGGGGIERRKEKKRNFFGETRNV